MTNTRRTPEQRLADLEKQQAALTARMKRETFKATPYGPAVLRAVRAVDAACDALGDDPHGLAAPLKAARKSLRAMLVGVGVAVR